MRNSYLWLLVFILLAHPVLAQQTTGNLTGAVLDPNGNPVVGATVELQGTSLQGVRQVMTDGNGQFRYPLLPVGTYSLRIFDGTGQSLTLDGLGVRLGQTTNVGNLTLTVGATQIEEMVVTGRSPVVDTASQELGSNLLESDFRKLPLDRDYRSIAAILPHTSPSFLGDGLNFAGSTGVENRFYIDGVDNTEPGGGESSTSLPYNFVQAMQVRMGGYQAEYRGTLGANVEAITRSGGNRFSGQVFGFFNNNRLTAQSAQIVGEEPDTDFTQYDAGLSFGGPLARDKLWYFLAYNPSVETEVVDFGDFGTYDDKTIRHSFAGKLDWRAGSSTDLRLSVMGDPGNQDQARPGAVAGYTNIDPFLYDNSYRRYSGGLDIQHWLGGSGLLHTSLSGFRSTFDQTPATDRGRNEVLFIDNGVVSGGTDTKGIYTRDDRVTWRLDGTWFLDRHDLKVGLDMIWKSHEGGPNGYSQARTTDPETGISIFNSVYWGFSPDALVKLRSPGFFLQDSWRIDDRWTMNFGLRLDSETIIGSNGETAQKIDGQWQPRLGISYAFGNETRQQVFTSVGRFYQDLNLLMIAQDYSDGGFMIRFTDYDGDPRIGTPDSTYYEWSSSILDEVDGMKGQYFDEATLGYERQFGSFQKVTIRGVYRTLGEGLEDGFNLDGVYAMGNPGSGPLSGLPKMKREYKALELTLTRSGADDYNYLLSYVLSRNQGNYPGLFASEYDGGGIPNGGPEYDFPEQLINGDGLLPNDRTHVLKLSGSWQALRRVQLGSSFYWMSGTPLNEFGTAVSNGSYHIFIQPRGTAGRTPSIWDWNVRLAWLTPWGGAGKTSRILLDLLHIGSPRKAVNFDQKHYQGTDDQGNQAFPNPNYLLATAYQPPFTVRLGVEVGF